MSATPKLSNGTPSSSSKPARPPVQTGLWPAEVIKDVAESVGIPSLSDTVAAGLAGDVEYRLHVVIEEAIKFMRHSKRSKLLPSDIDAALRVLNIEQLYSPCPATSVPTYRRVPTPQGPVFALEDREIDFDKALKEPLPALGKSVSYTAHWLAIEGVQPAIPQNPPPSINCLPTPAALAVPPPTTSTAAPPTAASATSAAAGAPTLHPPVKHLLSHELQLYYTRLTSALLSSAPGARDAALASLRGDPGLGGLVPYLVRFAGEQVAANLRDLNVLEGMVGVVGALVQNETLFVEPYLHQLLPLLLTTLLTSSLPAPPSPASLSLRTHSASLLSSLLQQFRDSYPSLAGRVTKTLLKALRGGGAGGAPGETAGTRVGAVLGLVAVGRGAALKALIRDTGVRSVGEAVEGLENEEARREVIDVVLDNVRSLLPMPDPTLSPADIDLDDVLGPVFAAEVGPDGELARAILVTLRDEDEDEHGHGHR